MLRVGCASGRQQLPIDPHGIFDGVQGLSGRSFVLRAKIVYTPWHGRLFPTNSPLSWMPAASGAWIDTRPVPSKLRPGFLLGVTVMDRNAAANFYEARRDFRKAGDCAFYSRRNTDAYCGLLFLCPCGCGELGGVMFNVPETADLNDAKWEWNGQATGITLKPSILRKSKCAWHGFLTDGQFVEC